jgi:RNA recognition motif-containing protein
MLYFLQTNATYTWEIQYYFRLNNLPLKVTKGEIEDFMFGIECRAIQIVRLPRGDCNGEAFVEFMGVEDAAKALKKHKQPLNGESGSVLGVYIFVYSRSLIC